MIVLALNCGSSSVKFRLVEADPGTPGGERTLASGLFGGLPGAKAVLTVRVGGLVEEEQIVVADHGAAVRRCLAMLAEERWHLPAIGAVGHRVVHGGDRFTAPVLIEAGILSALEALENLAPLHNGPSVAGIRAARAVLGKQIPMVAAFDTAFHASLPDRASRYALPADLALRHGIRRFGFHGLSYQSVLARFCRVTGTAPERARVVALHLGSGSSAVAIRDGRSVDTSMGFTPLEGLVMGTRAGDLDPALPGYLARKEGIRVEAVEEWLNTKSGLLGISGLSHDVRTLLAREADHAGARLALETFCYRARKYIGAYLAALGGAEAVIFTGGIGENAPEIRARICAGMEWCGLQLDPVRNGAAVGVEGRLSREGAPLQVYAIPSDEEGVIAGETACCVKRQQA